MTILEMHKYYCIGILKKKHLDEHIVLNLPRAQHLQSREF